MSRELELVVTFAVQLFIIVDPLAGIPVFLAITPDNTLQQRQAMALRGTLVAFGILTFFLFLGPLVLSYFGISSSAVRVAGGLLLFLIALEMLYGRTTGTGTSRREARLAESKEDISIVPLAFPLLAGPGAIATCLIFVARTEGPLEVASLLAPAALVLLLTYVLLARAGNLARLLGPLGTAILTRIMGLLLAFIAMQYVLDGLRLVWPK